MPAPARRTTDIRPVLPIYLVIYAAFIGYGMMVNFFVPLLMENHGFLPATASVAQRTTVVGILLAIYPLGQFFGSPVLGPISDRYGRKPILLISLAAAVGCYALIALAIQRHNLILLGIGCLAGGLTESNIAIAQSAIADITSQEDRGRLFSYIYTAISCGYISGPLFGGAIIARKGFAAPFWGVVVLLALTFVWTFTTFRETHAPDLSRRIDYRKALTNLTTVFTDRSLRHLYLINFIFYLTIFGFFRVILIYMADKWHMQAYESGVYYSYYAVMSLLASLLLTAPLLARFPIKTVAVVTAILSGVIMVLIVLPESRYWLWVTAGACSLISTVTLACCATLLSNAVEHDRQGAVMGNNQALQVGAEAASALFGGLLAALLAPLPLVVYGLLLVMAALMLLPMRIRVAGASAQDAPATAAS
jgi:MFS family permease